MNPLSKDKGVFIIYMMQNIDCDATYNIFNNIQLNFLFHLYQSCLMVKWQLSL